MAAHLRDSGKVIYEHNTKRCGDVEMMLSWNSFSVNLRLLS